MDNIDKELKNLNNVSAKQLDREKKRFIKEIMECDISDIVTTKEKKVGKFSFFKKIFKFL
jgi:hypothetical protein